MSTTSSLNFVDLIHEFRALGEFAKFAGSAWTWRLTGRTKHPRPILLIPGFMAGDVTLYPFANWLRSQGHKVFFSGIMANVDCPRRAVDRLCRILERLYDRHGEKVVVIGHSLGGVYARALAQRMPNQVAQTILLATPVTRLGQGSNPFVQMLATLTIKTNEFIHGCSGDFADLCGVHSATPHPDIPESIIFSKSDGVVDWVSCLESAPNVRTFEVDATHCGLPYNLDTLQIVHALIEDDSERRLADKIHHNGAAQNNGTAAVPH
jgi:triacylglycerol lipase